MEKTLHDIPKILVVDDERDMTTMLKRLFQRNGRGNVETALSGNEAIEKLHRFQPDIVITDVKMSGMDGISLLKNIKSVDPTISVILITGHGTVEMAVEAVQEGAYDFIEKPFDKGIMLHSAQRAAERTRLLRENRRLQVYASKKTESFHGIIGTSKAIRESLDLLARVADSDATVLLRGESGTGKELFAKALHAMSKRRHKKLVIVNCPALPEHILESELFGYAKGAFTGASHDKTGLFVAAQGSTIFLDEIGDIPVSVQTKLLRVLQEKEIRPLGSNSTIPIDVRVVASTNQDLEEKIRTGTFREDLFYRLNVVTVTLPPLRERKEDIPALAVHFLSKYMQEYNRQGLRFSSEALECLLSRPWKGNIRELENTIRRAVLLARNGMLEPPDLYGGGEPGDLPCAAAAITELLKRPYIDAKKSLVDQFSIRYIENILTRTGGNVTEAARISGLERQGLQRLMRRYEIRSRDYKKP